jgi:hypothetical protein
MRPLKRILRRANKAFRKQSTFSKIAIGCLSLFLICCLFAIPAAFPSPSSVSGLPSSSPPLKAKEGSWLTLDIVAGQPRSIKLDEKGTETARQRHESR